jgi:hypothetical protein
MFSTENKCKQREPTLKEELKASKVEIKSHTVRNTNIQINKKLKIYIKRRKKDITKEQIK